jgi:broad specificity phosphatase PhoE
MKKLTLTLTLLATVLASTLNAANVTTVILVRHAEKATAPANDPPLTAEGRERAKELARVVGKSGISAIFTTNLARTKQTAAPVAALLHLQPAVNANSPTYARDLANRIRTQHAGRTVLVVGHTNTTHDVIAALGVNTAPTIPETDFDNLYIVTLAEGHEPKLVSLKYGS